MGCKESGGLTCGVCHRCVYLGGTVTKGCRSCKKLYEKLERRAKETGEKSESRRSNSGKQDGQRN